MATITLTSAAPEAGTATAHKLTYVDLDFQEERLGGTIRLMNARGDTVRSFHLSGTFTELGIAQTAADDIAAKVTAWLKAKALLSS